ncbi:MAG: amidohydrolase family protein [Proteobacteria bacterium]|nr:amidohydrolase family protein [Pseudomonadota bacterium]
MSIFDDAKIDCHAHIFDPVHYPYGEDSFYKPAGQELGTPAQFLHVLDAYGVGHALLVQPNSGYDRDNRCMLGAIAASRGRLKGVAVVANDCSRSELEDLKAGGIVGIAFNAALFGVAHYADSGPLLERLAELGLFAQIQVQENQLVEFAPLLEAGGARLLFDHCGRPDMAAGLGQAGFQALLAFGRRGNAHVKLSGYVKFSQQAYPFEDTWPYVQALVEAFGSGGCIWGSDWPFLRAPSRVDYGPLLKLMERLLPGPAERRAVLWDNPRSLFGFDQASPLT